jgi:pimeloyl-ACP methyl ester carboxylesterase
MSETVVVSARSIAYRRLGSGRPLVLINGLAASGEDWDPVFLEGLAARNELILSDNRGTGGSSDDGEPLEIASLAADVAGVIAEATGGGRVAVLGWSMGGFIAQALALDRPDCVSRLVLLSTDSGGPDAQLGDPGLIAQIADLSPPPDEQARRLLSVLFGPEKGGLLYVEVGDVVAAARAKLRQDLLDRQVSALERWHRQGTGRRLSSLAVPTLIATGTEDRVIPGTNSVEMATQIPGAWLLQFAGAGHAFMAQHPQTLARVINEFTAL